MAVCECKICGKDYTAKRSDGKYCPDCLAESKRRYAEKYNTERRRICRERLEQRDCPQCGKTFKQTRYKQIFCSRQCCKAYHNAMRGNHNMKYFCTICGKEYTPNHPNRKTCSEECLKVRKNLTPAERYEKEKELLAKRLMGL